MNHPGGTAGIEPLLEPLGSVSAVQARVEIVRALLSGGVTRRAYRAEEPKILLGPDFVSIGLLSHFTEPKSMLSIQLLPGWAEDGSGWNPLELMMDRNPGRRHQGRNSVGFL